jgi:hypothetical protein
MLYLEYLEIKWMRTFSIFKETTNLDSLILLTFKHFKILILKKKQSLKS